MPRTDIAHSHTRPAADPAAPGPDGQARIERACADLSVAYARCLDFRDYDAFLTLFTEDAVLDVGRRLEGLAAIREDLRHRPDELPTAAGWRFAGRRLHAAFRDPGQWGPMERGPGAAPR